MIQDHIVDEKFAYYRDITIKKIKIQNSALFSRFVSANNFCKWTTLSFFV